MKGAVTLKRFDPETGEVFEGERKVRADHFKPKRPTMPQIDSSKVTLIETDRGIGPTGRSVIYMAGIREAELAYWEAHADCLTRGERRLFSAGRTTSVLRPLEPNWKKGDRLEVANNVEAEVQEVESTMRGYRSVFRVLDCRPWLPKRSTGSASPPKTDDEGYVLPPGPGDVEAARLDGNYTTSNALAVPEVDDESNDTLHRRLQAEAHMGTALKQSRRRVRQSKMRLEERIAEARSKHRRSTAKRLERELEHLEKKGERKNAKDPSVEST